MWPHRVSLSVWPHKDSVFGPTEILNVVTRGRRIEQVVGGGEREGAATPLHELGGLERCGCLKMGGMGGTPSS